MQSVSDKYYIWYNRVITVIALLIFLMVAASWTIPVLEPLQLRGFRPITAILATIQVVYSLVLYKRQARNNIWSGTLFSALTVSLIFIALIHNSGQFNSWFVLLLLVQVLMSGMFGNFVIIGSEFFITFYYIMALTGKPGPLVVSPYAIAILITSYALGLLSYFLWKSFYVNTDSRKVNQLTGQLKTKQLQTELLIKTITDGMIVTDMTGKISLLNPAAAKMTEWTMEEAMGLDVELVARFSEENNNTLTNDEHPFKKVLKTGKQISGIVQIFGRDNSKTNVVSIVVTPVVSEKSKELSGTVAVIRDVSAARLEEHRRADFISTASHEMRSPVAAIEGYLQLTLNEKLTKIDAKARDYLVKALESTHRLGKLFQDLLTSAKAEDGRLVNHPVVVEMSEYLDTISEGLRFAAEKKGMLVDYTVGAGNQDSTTRGSKVIRPLYYVNIDPDRMQEVITNLFDNAVKYSEKGKITIGLTGNDDVIQFFIRDTGHGIPAIDIPHLFQKFYRVDNSSTRTSGGTGLGLFICSKIVELYNGRIWVESELGKGSTFYINLPRISKLRATELQAKEVKQSLI